MGFIWPKLGKEKSWGSWVHCLRLLLNPVWFNFLISSSLDVKSFSEHLGLLSTSVVAIKADKQKMRGRKFATEALRYKRENTNPPGTRGKMKDTGKRGRKLISHSGSIFWGIYRTDLGNFQHSWRWMLLLAGVWRCSLEFFVSRIDQGLVLAGTWSESIPQNWCSSAPPWDSWSLATMPGSYLLQLAR